MTPIMELWQRIANGKLPEGVTIRKERLNLYMGTPQPGWKIYLPGGQTDWIDNGSHEWQHLSALMRVMGRWEAQGPWTFTRRAHKVYYPSTKESGVHIEWDAHYDEQGIADWAYHSDPSEIIALGTVLAELGERAMAGGTE